MLRCVLNHAADLFHWTFHLTIPACSLHGHLVFIHCEIMGFGQLLLGSCLRLIKREGVGGHW